MTESHCQFAYRQKLINNPTINQKHRVLQPDAEKTHLQAFNTSYTNPEK